MAGRGRGFCALCLFEYVAIDTQVSFLPKGVSLLLIEYGELSWCEAFEVIVLRVQTTTGSYPKPIVVRTSNHYCFMHGAIVVHTTDHYCFALPLCSEMSIQIQ